MLLYIIQNRFFKPGCVWRLLKNSYTWSGLGEKYQCLENIPERSFSTTFPEFFLSLKKFGKREARVNVKNVSYIYLIKMGHKEKNGRQNTTYIRDNIWKCQNLSWKPIDGKYFLGNLTWCYKNHSCVCYWLGKW